MKKVRCFLLTLAVATLANAQSDPANFNLSIKTDKKIILENAQLVNADGYNKTVTGNNEYVFSNVVDRYGQYSLSVSYVDGVTKKKRTRNIQLLLKPGNSELSFYGTAGSYRLTGASANIQKDFEAFISTDQLLLKRVLMFDAKLDQYQQSKNRTGGKKIKDSLQHAIKVRKTMLESFIRQHPDDDLSLYVMEVYSTFNRENPLEIKSLLSALNKDLQETEAMMSVKKRAEENEKFMTGMKAPEFRQEDTSGTVFELSSLRGKYVLIDFWASWCKPCRAQNPALVRLYQKYKDKGFTILGISLDGKKEPWIKAINEDKLEWQHVSDLKSWKNAVARQYKISSVPQNFLLNPDGIILGKNFHEDDLEEFLRKELRIAN